MFLLRGFSSIARGSWNVTPANDEGWLQDYLDTENGGDLDQTLIKSKSTTANVDKIASCSQTARNSESSILRQHKVFVHASWLAVHSSYFRRLFYSGMTESRTKKVHLKIPESEEKAYLLLLKAICRPEILKTVSTKLWPFCS